MKRHLLGLFAIVLAVGFSSFNSIKKAKYNTDYYWFQISTAHSYNTNAAVLQADATFLDFGSISPTGTGCDEINTKQCVSGFAESDVQLKAGETEIYELKNDLQVPEVTPRRRP